MAAKQSQSARSMEIITWLQRRYIQVPGAVYITASDLYESYETYMKTCCHDDLLSKKQIGQIVLKIFDKVTVVHNNASRYKGLRLNFMKEQSCSLESLKSVASEYGFFSICGHASSVQYACLTGYRVNKNQQMKIITIKNDKSFDVSVGGIQVDLSTFGLNDLLFSNVTDARIIFNTVKQSKPCTGKSVKSKQNTTKFSVVQEWSRIGDENSCELRLTSGKCHGAVPFTFHSESCYKCQQQRFTERKTASETVAIDKEQLIKSLYPGASEYKIINDTSEKKESSHFKLKINCLASSAFLSSKDFTKNDLFKLCSAYGVSCASSMKKEDLAEVISNKIKSRECMVNSDFLKEDAQLPSTSSTQTEASRRKRTKTPGKGKGRGKGKRLASKYFCKMCNEEYVDVEDWIQCDDCNGWFHRMCGEGLIDDESWERVQAEEAPWSCTICTP